MNLIKTAQTIKALRERQGMTQQELASRLAVSDKTISKWETAKGLPDISLLEPLAGALGISVAELFAGASIQNNNRHADIRRLLFYVCPLCGNVVTSFGELYTSCCGHAMVPAEPQEPDDAHALQMEQLEEETYLTVNHPMEKGHYLPFLAVLTADDLHLHKLYPEQMAEARFALRGHATCFYYCTEHGLFRQKIR